jgi:hypothetical protein
MRESMMTTTITAKDRLDHLVFGAGTHTATTYIPDAELARLVEPVPVAAARHR